MARTSRVEKERTHQRIVNTASHAFRANGVVGTSIPALMEDVGLTHGTFYTHFESKDALIAETYTRGIAEVVDNLLRYAEAAPAGQELNAVIAHYLSAEHRDDPASGCVLPALAGEVRRESPPVRAAFTEALRRFFDRLAPLIPAHNAREQADRALVLVSGMVGTVLLARAVDDPELSDRMLHASGEYYAGAFAALGEEAR